MRVLDEKTAIKLRKRAVFSAKRYGLGDQAEDIAQEVLLHYLSGKGQHQTVDQATIDVARRTSGDKRTRGYLGGRDPLKFAGPLDHVENRADTKNVCGDDAEFKRLVGFARAPFKRGLLTLRHKWGFSQLELGEIFGFTESRVCQIITASEAEISKGLAREERGENIFVQGKGQEEKESPIQDRSWISPGLASVLEEVLPAQTGWELFCERQRKVLERAKNRCLAEIEPEAMEIADAPSFDAWLT